MKDRSLQDLLGERRLLVIEHASLPSHDKTTSGMLKFSIDEIDRASQGGRVNASARQSIPVIGEQSAPARLIAALDAVRDFDGGEFFASARDIPGVLATIHAWAQQHGLVVVQSEQTLRVLRDDGIRTLALVLA